MNVLVAHIGKTRFNILSIARNSSNPIPPSCCKVPQLFPAKILSAFVEWRHRFELLPQDLGAKSMPQGLELVRSMLPCRDVKDLVEFF